MYWLTYRPDYIVAEIIICRGEPRGAVEGANRGQASLPTLYHFLELICFVWQRWRVSCPSCSPRGSLCGPMSLGGVVVMR